MHTHMRAHEPHWGVCWVLAKDSINSATTQPSVIERTCLTRILLPISTHLSPGTALPFLLLLRPASLLAARPPRSAYIKPAGRIRYAGPLAQQRMSNNPVQTHRTRHAMTRLISF